MLCHDHVAFAISMYAKCCVINATAYINRRNGASRSPARLAGPPAGLRGAPRGAHPRCEQDRQLRPRAARDSRWSAYSHESSGSKARALPGAGDCGTGAAGARQRGRRACWAAQGCGGGLPWLRGCGRGAWPTWSLAGRGAWPGAGPGRARGLAGRGAWPGAGPGRARGLADVELGRARGLAGVGPAGGSPGRRGPGRRGPGGRGAWPGATPRRRGRRPACGPRQGAGRTRCGPG
jgi:hypothetical protein